MSSMGLLAARFALYDGLAAALRVLVRVALGGELLTSVRGVEPEPEAAALTRMFRRGFDWVVDGTLFAAAPRFFRGFVLGLVGGTLLVSKSIGSSLAAG